MITKKTRDALEMWLDNYPDSYHPCDMDRFYSLMKTSFSNGDLDALVALDLDTEVERIKPDWDAEYRREFSREWERNISLCKGLLEYEA